MFEFLYFFAYFLCIYFAEFGSLHLILIQLARMDIMDYEDECPSDEEKVATTAVMRTDMNGWAELYLKDEIKKALRENAFQCPSQVQKTAIPVIMQGRDLICQARSGMGKTAVFIIGILNKLSLINEEYTPFNTLVICHTRELAHQVNRDFRRFSRHFKKPELRVGCYFGGIQLDVHKKQLTNKAMYPHIVVGSPGRLMQLVVLKIIPLDKIQHFVIDECDQILQDIRMLSIVKKIFQQMPRQRQVLMFTATLSAQSYKIAKQFLTNQENVAIDTGKLFIPGLQQYYVKIKDEDKLNKLMAILDGVNFDQGVIFVNRIQRAIKLNSFLIQKLFNPICIHSTLTQGERIISYDSFKANKYRILVATDLFGRGVDVERVNLVINYDLPRDRETYLHRIGRAGRFNTKGTSISFVRPDDDTSYLHYERYDREVFDEIEDGLKYKIIELPKNLEEII